MDGAVLKTFAILLASVALVFGVLVLIKKYSNKFINQPNRIPLKILAKLPLNQKSFLCIVEAEGKLLLLGVTEKSINLISELNDEFDLSNVNLKTLKKKKSDNTDIKNPEKDLSFLNFLKSTIGIRTNQN